ncbi:MAG: FtsX-like permease family protein [Proteobacteria bacterium]|nr:MAG: FtsX-like permease family protein [Pseudomonadota bacterium]
MALILNVMAYLTTFTGMLVIYSIAQQQALARRWDHNLLKILGAEFPVLKKASAIEFLSISGFAGLLGACIGIATSYIIAKVLFKGIWTAQLVAPLALTAGLIVLCLLTGMAATMKILGSKPELQVES